MGACSNLSPVEKCLAIIAHGAEALQDNNFALAEGAFRAGLAIAKAAPAEQGHDLVPLVLLNMSRLRHTQDREDDARQLREQANAQLGQNLPSLPNAFFHLSMAAVLIDLGEYRRAIPFWEQAMQLDDLKTRSTWRTCWLGSENVTTELA
jgi:tetratricopeptide (TPR) repeat protein